MRGLCGSYAGRLCGRFVQEVYAGFMRGLCGVYAGGLLGGFMREVCAGGLCGAYAGLCGFMRRLMREVYAGVSAEFMRRLMRRGS